MGPELRPQPRPASAAGWSAAVEVIQQQHDASRRFVHTSDAASSEVTGSLKAGSSLPVASGGCTAQGSTGVPRELRSAAPCPSTASTADTCGCGLTAELFCGSCALSRSDGAGAVGAATAVISSLPVQRVRFAERVSPQGGFSRGCRAREVRLLLYTGSLLASDVPHELKAACRSLQDVHTAGPAAGCG